jgi:hypothetical protein
MFPRTDLKQIGPFHKEEETGVQEKDHQYGIQKNIYAMGKIGNLMKEGHYA